MLKIGSGQKKGMKYKCLKEGEEKRNTNKQSEEKYSETQQGLRGY